MLIRHKWWCRRWSVILSAFWWNSDPTENGLEVTPHVCSSFFLLSFFPLLLLLSGTTMMMIMSQKRLFLRTTELEMSTHITLDGVSLFFGKKCERRQNSWVGYSVPRALIFDDRSSNRVRLIIPCLSTTLGFLLLHWILRMLPRSGRLTPAPTNARRSSNIHSTTIKCHPISKETFFCWWKRSARVTDYDETTYCGRNGLGQPVLSITSFPKISTRQIEINARRNQRFDFSKEPEASVRSLSGGIALPHLLSLGHDLLFSGNSTRVIRAKDLVKILEGERVVGKEFLMVPIVFSNIHACKVLRNKTVR